MDLAQPARGQFQDEIVLLRVIIDRIARSLKPRDPPGRLARDGTDLSFNETVFSLHVVTMAISRLNGFYRANRLLNPNDDDKLREFLRRKGFTEEQIHEEKFGSSSASASQEPERTSQARAVAADALPGGFYASVFQPAESRRLHLFDKRDLDEEIALLRILIKRTLASMNRKGHASPVYIDTLHAYRVIIYAAACLERLERTKCFVLNERRPPADILGQRLNEALAEYWQKHPQMKGPLPDDQSTG